MADDSGSPLRRRAVGVRWIEVHRCAPSGPSSGPVHVLLCNYPHTEAPTTEQLSRFRRQQNCEAFSDQMSSKDTKCSTSVGGNHSSSSVETRLEHVGVLISDDRSRR